MLLLLLQLQPKAATVAVVQQRLPDPTIQSHTFFYECNPCSYAAEAHLHIAQLPSCDGVSLVSLPSCSVSVRDALQVLVPMIAYVAAPASGAHFNPIVTFAFMATGILVRQLYKLHLTTSMWQQFEIVCNDETRLCA